MPMFRVALASMLAFAVALPAAAKTMAYPTADTAEFLIDVPTEWEGEAAEEEGGFMNITGPSGILVSLRTVQKSEYTIEEVIQEAQEFLRENYADVHLMEPTFDGRITHTQAGVGNNEGESMVFANVWTIGPGFIFEVRIATGPDDKASVEEAMQIVQTIREAE